AKNLERLRLDHTTRSPEDITQLTDDRILQQIEKRTPRTIETNCNDICLSPAVKVALERDWFQIIQKREQLQEAPAFFSRLRLQNFESL
ncbi:MAG: hypothetical protein MHM6MM_006083, partial [Cercozoa sp. M6MM]